jgi:hypothetical protein
MAKSKSNPAVYQLRVSLRGSKPPIWRRLQVPSNITLGHLHTIIQDSFAWDESHKHIFETKDRRYIDYDDPLGDFINERRARLSRALPEPGAQMIYVYDFGDSWTHIIRLEKILEPEEGVVYPRCTGGRRAAPPEDTGGIYRYEYLVAAIANPTHRGYQEAVEWLGRDFDPERFSPEAVTDALSRLPFSKALKSGVSQ